MVRLVSTNLFFFLLVLSAVQRPTVNELVRECSTADWHQLGRHLGIDMHILRDIDLDYQRVDRKRSEMFDSWLRSNPDASWEHVITALEDMGEIVLVGEIAQRHCGRRITTGGPEDAGLYGCMHAVD